MSLKPATKEAFSLLMRGAEAFTRIEAAGIKVDVPYLDKSIKDVTAKIGEMEQAIVEDPIYKLWVKTYGNDMKLGSRTQLGNIIFNLLGHKRNKFLGLTNSSAAFEHLKLPFVRHYQDVERLKKALSTNLNGLKRETVNGYVHAFQHLHTAESYRSNSTKPNLHNFPVRNKDIARIVRTSLIPRKNHVFLEPDLETHEVRISYCYNKDPKLLSDILSGDMHKDRALDLYMLTPEELGPVDREPGKTVRYIAKNKFVFAQFYGSYFAQCAPELWDAIAIYGLKRADGVSLFEHLESKGIKKLGCIPKKGNRDKIEFEDPVKGTFEYHVMEVEIKMWEESYRVYNQWKKDWYNLYQQNGGIHTKTGFTLEGIFRRNQILCDPIQGSAFHCLLWIIIEATNIFRKRKMRTRIVNQVHDSMLLDTHRNEIEDVCKIISDLVLRKLPKAWPWIIAPLGMGFDIAEDNWFEKKPLDFVVPV